MGRVEKTVFLSHRRTNIPWALAIFQYLTHHGYDVFVDYTGIPSRDFERAIIENIRARAHFLVLLTPSALERCHVPGDGLRQQIEEAFDCQRNIVPLILEGFDFGSRLIAGPLTGRLETLPRYNALTIPVDYFEAAMERLCERYLDAPRETVLRPISPAASHAAKGQQVNACGAPAVTEKALTAQRFFERGFDTADVDEKLRFYNQAILLNPDYAAAFHNRGNARVETKDFEGAINDFNEAIRLQPDDATAIYSRGNARLEMGDLTGAGLDFTEADRLRK